MAKRIILFGGSFNPVHLGHIEIAHCAAKKIVAKKIILIPANRSPHKQAAPEASGVDRMKMLALATADKPVFEINDCELNRPGPSYTLDTIRYFREKLGSDTALHLLVGADVLTELGKWYKVNELMDECIITVMCRGGFERDDFGDLEKYVGSERLKRLLGNMVETPTMEISSSQIRQMIKTGQSTEGLLCEAVADYIAQKQLYK